MPGYRLGLGCGVGSIVPPQAIDGTWEAIVRVHPVVDEGSGSACGATLGLAVVAFT